MCKTLAVDGKLGAFPFSPFRSESRQLTTECTVTYGGMAKTGLTLPPSLFIFKKLTSCVPSPSSSHTPHVVLLFCRPPLPSLPHEADLSSSHSTGFWLSNWVQTHPEERISMMQTLATLTSQGKLKEPETEVVKLGGTDEEVGAQLKEVMTRIEEGRGKKVLLHWSEERVE
jgi:trans-2-enoyl-CoA reductase